jgi:transposase
MKARYQYRFYPTIQQQQSLAQLFGCVRVVWNDALAICKQAKKLPSNNNLQKLVITQAKKTVEREYGDNLELYVKLSHKSLIESSVLLVDGKQQVKFALNVDTNGVNLIRTYATGTGDRYIIST